MAMADLIPTGRTSLVKRGDMALQVQTEYAHRPVPRITTTVQKSGQVLHKIERSLEQPIASIEEKDRMETTIRKQHAEIVAIIKRGGQPVAPPKPKPSEPKPYPEPDQVPITIKWLSQIPGQHRIFRLDNEGNFLDASISNEFARMFKAVFKNLHELISVFATVPGIGLMREPGVYEVERNALYLVSTGTEFYILCIQRADYSINYEKEICAIIAGL